MLMRDAPESLKGYLFHGLNLDWDGRKDEAVGDCPWCGRERKFSVNVGSGLWRCLVCNEGSETEKAIRGGNLLVFLRMLWEKAFANTSTADYQLLAADRSLLYPETLVSWQFAKSPTTGNWLMPGFHPEGRMTGLYQYVRSGGRMLWMPTPGLGHHLLGINLVNKEHLLYYVAEGPWDATSIWEALGCAKNDADGKIVQTANRSASFLGEESVVGIAACQTFSELWVPMFRDKVVCLLCQNDHEKRMCADCKKSYSRHERDKCPSCGASKITDQVIPPASYNGMSRIAKIISSVTTDIHYLHWGDNGYDPEFPSGFDVRDLISK